ncbi:O-acetyltransferase OatA [Serratia entomophila]|uniref:Acyltransferase n=1 Tax=Serratia entomophila TaxID=42906 RepID=A0ABY5CWS3_9GAMM|nr:acyltransferase [Serratia entomophila]UIW19509.1 acyltransferase [Serratia entomophila]USV02034.1 acyltransferase [Serratia entomophila]CAI0691586.1 O-acetyltransferase OatA [Serratia entomophila]CAI0719602.1 O-acetyltransferase OatA [Serratia entomophila]CAI0765071.1 O-acetyltransferase OatA [Serratia entomophila]
MKAVEPPVKKNSLMSITYMRCLACLLVVVCHSQSFSQKLSVDGFDILFGYGGRIGELGVIIFFMISGYLMTYVHWGDFKNNKSLNFMKKRFFRVAPMYYLFTIITILAFIINRNWFPSTEINAKSSILSAFFIPDIFEKNSNRLVTPLSVGWTLCYEMFFYLLFSISLLMRRLTGLLFVIAVISAICLYGAIVPHSEKTLIGFYTSPIMLYFVSGIVICALQFKIKAKTDHGILVALVFIIGILACVISNLNEVVLFISLSLLFALATFVNTTGQGLTMSFVSYLGLASYSIYLCHRLVMGAVNAVASKTSFVDLSHSGQYLYSAVMVLISLIAGCICYSLIESKINAYSKREMKLATK